MAPFEYALGLFSVLVGLALADIAQKVHRLVRHARTISWDGRAILATMLVIIVIVSCGSMCGASATVPRYWCSAST